MSAPLLQAQGVSKVYGAVEALKPLDLTVSTGAVHGVLGKNGAGKSTLIGIVAGSVQPTAGRILLEGQDVTRTSLVERRRLGIRLLNQHSEIVPALSVAENLLMPHFPRRRGLIDWQLARQEAVDVLERYGLKLDPTAVAGALSVPDQRKLNIVKTLATGGKLAMLDEPTTSLTRVERQSLFDWIRELNDQGETFIYISHFNIEIQQLCDEYTVLRDGGLVSTGENPGDIAAAKLSELVAGADVHEFQRQAADHSEPLLDLEGFRPAGVEPVTVTLRRGEILGLVGLPGSGASQVARALAGLHPIEAGTVTLDGAPIAIRSVAGALDHGIAYQTNDRIGEGLVPELSVRESLRVGRWPTTGAGLIDTGSMQSTFARIRDQLSMQVSGPDQLVRQLSGGNQQKVLLGRLLAAKPKVLILDEPTLGIDVGVKEEVHRIIDELTAAGIGVIVLAYDTDEFVRLVDRAIVFRDGRVADELAGDELTIDGVLAALDTERVKAA